MADEGSGVETVTCKVCGGEFQRITASHVRTHDMSMAEYEKYEAGEEQEVAPVEEVPTVLCKLCGQAVLESGFILHVGTVHQMSMAEYDKLSMDPSVYEGVAIYSAQPVREPPPEPTVEKMVSVVLREDVPSNPDTTAVEARLYHVYHFKQGKPQDIPEADAAILCGNPPEYVGKYSWLRFKPTGGKT